MRLRDTMFYMRVLLEFDLLFEDDRVVRRGSALPCTPRARSAYGSSRLSKFRMSTNQALADLGPCKGQKYRKKALDL